MSDIDTLERLLRCGSGRAILFLRNREATSYRDLILEACRHDWTLYPLESDRGRYLFDVLQATGEPDWYAPRLRHALLAANGKGSQAQLMNIARHLARFGNEAMHQAIQKVLSRSIVKGDTTGARDLIALDGVEGYRFIARLLMRHPLPDDDCWMEYDLLRDLEDELGQTKARKALKQVCRDDADLAAYVKRTRKQRAKYRAKRRRKHAPPPKDYEELQRRIDTPGVSVGSRNWMSDVDDAFVYRLAQGLLTETDPERLKKYLSLFEWRAYPLAPDKLIEIARDAVPPLNGFGVAAVAQIVHADVRALGRELIQSTERTGDGVGILVKNYEEGDYDLVAAAVHRTHSPGDMHYLGIQVQEFIEANPRPEAVPVLMRLYEESDCSMCRWRIVELLATFGPLPRWMREECRWDAETALRDFIIEQERGTQRGQKQETGLRLP